MHEDFVNAVQRTQTSITPSLSIQLQWSEDWGLLWGYDLWPNRLCDPGGREIQIRT